MTIYKYDAEGYVKDACCPDRDMLAELFLAANATMRTGIPPVIAARDTLEHPYFADLAPLIDKEGFVNAVAKQAREDKQAAALSA